MLIARNHAVFCLSSMVRISGIDFLLFEGENEESNHQREEFIKNICGETLPYEELYRYYSDAKNGIENQFFVKVSRINPSLFLRVTNMGDIFVFRYQDRFRIKRKRLIPWDYPHTISCIGKANGKSERQVVDDYKTLSVIDFLWRYRLELPLEKEHKISKKEDMYEIDGVMQVLLDTHVTFRYVDYHGAVTEQYICDSWWEEDETILSDLLLMSSPAYSQKYHTAEI